jgi:hypothetical protein
MPRRIFIHCVLIAFLGIAAFDIAAGIEHWPFSNYPMYIGVQGPTYTWFEMYGQSATGEIPIVMKSLRPFDDGRLGAALGRFGPESLDLALADCRRIYNADRDAGLFSGPPISGLKLYLVTRELNAGPAPSRKVLVRESHR